MLLPAFILIGLLYQIQVAFLVRGLWHKINNPPTAKKLQESVAIVIPHRNEADSLIENLQHIQKLLGDNYSWRIVVLDDHSAEEHVELLRAYQAQSPISLIESEAKAGKKSALAWLFPKMEEDYILQIDADCEVDKGFFAAINARLVDSSPDLVVARVQMEAGSNVWSRLAAIDHLSLQLVTFSGLAQKQPLMAAGAAMAFKREKYLELMHHGADWAGGEDTFFTQALANSNGQISAAPEALVLTGAPENFRAFIRQRLRWGAKSVAYISTWSKFLAIVVALSNLYILYGIFSAALGYDGTLVFYFWSLKITADALLLYRHASLYGGLSLLKGYLFLALIYPFYIALVVVLIPFAAKDKWLSS